MDGPIKLGWGVFFIALMILIIGITLSSCATNTTSIPGATEVQRAPDWIYNVPSIKRG